jgi:hypothetical protein
MTPLPLAIRILLMVLILALLYCAALTSGVGDHTLRSMP